jgi:hypothetical protein
MEDKQGVTCLACMRVLGSIPTKWGGGMKLINEMSFIKKKKNPKSPSNGKLLIIGPKMIL